MYAKHLMFMGGVLMFGLGVSQCDTNQCDETIYANDGATDDVFVYCGEMFGNGCSSKMVA